MERGQGVRFIKYLPLKGRGTGVEGEMKNLPLKGVGGGVSKADLRQVSYPLI
jgi:hypothetical protein